MTTEGRTAVRKTAAKKEVDLTKTATEAVAEQAIDDELAALRAERDKLLEEKALREETERLRREAEEEAAIVAAVEAAPPRKEREPLRLQSRYRGFHAVQLKPHRRVVHPTLGIIEPVIGVYATFEGKQNLFDSARAQEKYGWDDETTDAVERMLVLNDGFMTDYYPAAMTTIPEHLLALAKTKPPAIRKRCQGFTGWSEEGELVQCKADPRAGSPFCEEHDPEVTKIMHGGGTTVG